MSPDANRRRPFNECRYCGELNPRTNRVCGVCGTPFDPDEVVSELPAAGDATTVAWVLAAAAIVSLGVFLLAPGLGIMLAVLLIVPSVRTALVLGRRAERGKRTTTAATVAMFVSSAGATLVILTVVTVAAVGTFCFVCVAGATATDAMGHRAFDSIQLLIAVSALAALAVVLPVCYAFAKWVRERWRRDIGDGDNPPA